jgi:acetyl esterase/lipase
MSSVAALLLISVAFAQETIVLRSAPAGAAPEVVEDRGAAGVRDRAVSNVSEPSLTVYLPPRDRATGAAVIVCPGGGYQRLALDKEGHEVARWLAGVGVAGFVLKYRLPGKDNMQLAKGPLAQASGAARVAVEDAREALGRVRAGAARWGLRPDAIGIMGFSAGGNLAALMGLVGPARDRPNFQVLVYPALPVVTDVAGAPPAFLAHAYDDKTVDVESSVHFFSALHAAGIPAELHVYGTGGHGFGMRKSDKLAAGWTTPLAAWLATVTKRK